MSKAAWAFAALLFISGIVMVVHFGLQPQPVRMIKTGYVESAEEAGFFVWKRLRHVLLNEKKLVFGVQSEPAHYDLINGIIEAAATENLQYETKVNEIRLAKEELPAAVDWQAVDTQRNLNDLVRIFVNAPSALLLMPSVYSSHLVGENPVRFLEKATAKRLPTISVVRLVLSPAEVGRIQPTCDAEGTFGKPRLSALGCAAQRKSTGIFRKNFDLRRFVMAMDQMGEKDYLVYLYAPVQ
jgi:hypothetical protein